ncbi:MAG: ferrous iron transport protein A [Desulfobulbaceae bacterium]|nr:ferrous iron transport protein A [Desulfobulbaceae bacterium]
MSQGQHKQRHRHGQKKCCRLHELKPGEGARILCHHTKGATRQRLLDLGFVPQAQVDVIRRAPLGDPIECRVANFKVALRVAEAALIEVES